jgi:hypothetical protein
MHFNNITASTNEVADELGDESGENFTRGQMIVMQIRARSQFCLQRRGIQTLQQWPNIAMQFLLRADWLFPIIASQHPSKDLMRCDKTTLKLPRSLHKAISSRGSKRLDIQPAVDFLLKSEPAYGILNWSLARLSSVPPY